MNQFFIKLFVRLVAHGKIQPCLFVYNALVMGEGRKALPSVVGAHTALAKADNGIAVVCLIQLNGLRYIDSRGIGNGFIVNEIRNFVLVEGCFQTLGEAEITNAGICNDENGIALFPADNLRQRLDAANDFWLEVG